MTYSRRVLSVLLLAAFLPGCIAIDSLRPDWMSVDLPTDLGIVPIAVPGPHTYGGDQPTVEPYPNLALGYANGPIAALTETQSAPGLRAQVWSNPIHRLEENDARQRWRCLSLPEEVTFDGDRVYLPAGEAGTAREARVGAWVRFGRSGLHSLAIETQPGVTTMMRLGGFDLLAEANETQRQRTIYLSGEGDAPILLPLEIVAWRPNADPIELRLSAGTLGGAVETVMPPGVYDQEPIAWYRANGQRELFATLDKLPFQELAPTCGNPMSAEAQAERKASKQNPNPMELLLQTTLRLTTTDHPAARSAATELRAVLNDFQSGPALRFSNLSFRLERIQGALFKALALGERDSSTASLAEAQRGLAEARRLFQAAPDVTIVARPCGSEGAFRATPSLDGGCIETRLAGYPGLEPIEPNAFPFVLTPSQPNASAIVDGSTLKADYRFGASFDFLFSIPVFASNAEASITILPFRPGHRPLDGLQEGGQSASECGGFIGNGIYRTGTDESFYPDIDMSRFDEPHRQQACNKMRKVQRAQAAEATEDELWFVYRLDGNRSADKNWTVKMKIETVSKNGCGAKNSTVYHQGEVRPVSFSDNASGTGFENRCESVQSYKPGEMYAWTYDLEELPLEDFNFCNLYHQLVRVTLTLEEDGLPISEDWSTFHLYNLEGMLELYKYMSNVVVEPHARMQGETNPLIGDDLRKHPLRPVLRIGMRKAINYSLGLQRDWALEKKNFSDPCWLAQVGTNLELLTGLGVLVGAMNGDYLGRPIAPWEIRLPIVGDFGHPAWFADPPEESAGWEKLIEAVGAAGPPNGQCFWESCQYEPYRRILLGEDYAWPGPVAEGSGIDRWLKFSWWARNAVAAETDSSNILRKAEATTSFLYNHHLDLRYGIQMAGRLDEGFAPMWQRIHEDAMRSTFCELPDAYSEFDDLAGPLIFAADAGAGGSYRIAFGTGEPLYRLSLNMVGDWSKERGLVDCPDEKCVGPFKEAMYDIEAAED